MTVWLSVSLASALFAATVIALRLRFAHHGVDLPGERSLHAQPTPHGGGLPIVLAALLAGLWAGVAPLLLIAVVALATLSMIDDWLHLPVSVRLPVHLAAAASVVFLALPESWPLAVIMTIAIAWATNAYNFMDGADGLAGTMAFVGFGAYAAAFAFAGQFALAVLCVAVMGAAVGFLLFNWHPARVFMGDVGSIPLGFLAGALGWTGVFVEAWPGWFALMAFAPFLLDATLTLLRRVLRGERIWQAHREHCYQRLVRLGMNHGAMCSRWAALMLVGALLALVVLRLAPAWGWLLLALWWSVLLMLGLRVDAHWKHRMMAR